jgi:pyruvate formate lyase activating enzyme
MQKNAMLFAREDHGLVQCYLCSHRCRIQPDGFGLCGVRQNIGGELYTFAYGEVIARNVDPVEKKPLLHFLPGSKAYSIATIGCNFKCDFCQNWQISQASFKNGDMGGEPLSPETVVQNARRTHCASIAYTYTEPTIFFEYARDIAVIAHRYGIKNVFVTNGYMTPEALELMSPYLDACNVDLKSFRDSYYKTVCRGRLEPVLQAIKTMKRLNIWVEVTTLVLPDQNDSEKELTEIANFIVQIDPDIPWHISRFFPKYRAVDIRPTPMESMFRAEEIGKKAGLRYVYLGNIGAQTDTHCPNCNKLLIRRSNFAISSSIQSDGLCPSCENKIAGVWHDTSIHVL